MITSHEAKLMFLLVAPHPAPAGRQSAWRRCDVSKWWAEEAGRRRRAAALRARVGLVVFFAGLAAALVFGLPWGLACLISIPAFMAAAAGYTLAEQASKRSLLALCECPVLAVWDHGVDVVTSPGCEVHGATTRPGWVPEYLKIPIE